MDCIKTNGKFVIEINFNRIGSRIGQRRRELGYKQSYVAEIVGISTKHMSNIETGKNKPSLEVIIKLSHILDVSVDYFLNGTYMPQPSGNIEQNASMCSLRDQEIIEDITNIFLNHQEKK